MRILTRRRLAIALVGLLISGAVSLGVYAWWPGAPIEVRVSRATTYYAGPLLDDGRVDYWTILERARSGVVCPGGNAALPLLEVMGASHVPPASRRVIARALAVSDDDLPMEGCFVPWEDWICRQPQPGADKIEDLGGLCDVVIGDNRLPGGTTEWLAENERALALLDDASWRSRFYLPMAGSSDAVLDTADRVDPYKLRNLTWLLQISLRRQVLEGNVEQAADEILRMCRLGALLQQSTDELVVTQGHGLRRIGIDECEALMAGGHLPGSLARRMLMESNAVSLAIPLRERLQMWRCIALAMVARSAPNESAIEIDPNLVMEASNAVFDRVEDMLAKGVDLESVAKSLLPRERPRKSYELPKWQTREAARQRSFGGRLTRSLRSREAGERLAIVLAYSTVNMASIWLRCEEEYQLWRADLAVYVFLHETGRLPESLAEAASHISDDDDWVLNIERLVYVRNHEGYTLHIASKAPSIQEADASAVRPPVGGHRRRTLPPGSM